MSDLDTAFYWQERAYLAEGKVERLTAEIERLRAALTWALDRVQPRQHFTLGHRENEAEVFAANQAETDALDNARTLLE